MHFCGAGQSALTLQRGEDDALGHKLREGCQLGMTLKIQKKLGDYHPLVLPLP
jgi:hypothetical protein